MAIRTHTEPMSTKFTPHNLIKRLIKHGMKEPAAEELVEFIEDRTKVDVSDLATKADILLVKQDVALVKQDVALVKQDVNVLKQDVNVLKQDVDVLKQDVNVLKQDVNVLKQDVNVLKQDVNVLKQDVNVLKQDVNVLKQDVAHINQEISHMKKDMATKADIALVEQKMKADLEKTKNEILKWQLGIMVALASLIIACFRYFSLG